ncbi:MerR family transcriptional regulator [Sphingomonas lenta]|uniref:MerR family transcriptional regulator n=1 Tax=Sphingomonas lenta TaxID=1141887 RepID=A0A2A2SEX2_9SPHN|nr:MerR family transcriptional regulator [Sphingomonas lenta]PAX07551.1 MerR family transcriptional regulator [Sphingomonas lenta]
MTEPPAKAAGAFRTIGELSRELGLPQHVLRYWETRFPQLKPLQRAGNRRYYRPEDVALAKRIDRLLNREGYTVRGVQQLLAREGGGEEAAPQQSSSDLLTRVRIVRDRLAAALSDD